MTYEEIIKGAGEKLGVELEIVDGATSLGLDDMTVSVLELPELTSIVLSGVIGEPPPQGLLKLYEALLDANCNFAGTSGATLARDPETGAVKLMRCVPMGMLDVDGFLSVLENFANVMETWQKIIANYRPDESAAERPAAATAPHDNGYPSFGGGFMQV